MKFLTKTLPLLIWAVVFAGCGKKTPPPSEPSAAPKPSVSVEAAPEAAPAPVPAAPDAPAIEPATGSTEAPAGAFSPPVEQAMGQLTMFVQQFYNEHNRLPKDLGELVKPAGYLPYIYAPPAGKRWVIDAAKKEVKLADR